MNSKTLNNIAIALVLITLAIITRLIPHPWSFTCVGSVLLFSVFYFKNKSFIHVLVPMTIMLVSDLFLLYFYNKPFAGIGIYLCWLVYIPTGSLLIKKIKIKTIALAGISGATLFFLTSNFLVWINGTMYPLNLSGLISCYVAAIPFYLNSIAGNLVWSSIIFGIYELSINSIKDFSLNKKNNY
tara:strand:+ start:976 stop:1527 length:552 start_codon:yes stop_codon:yes gene_type:complete